MENVRDEVGSFGLLNRAFVPETEKITEPAIEPLELETRSALEPSELAAGPAPKPVSNESGKFRKSLIFFKERIGHSTICLRIQPSIIT